MKKSLRALFIPMCLLVCFTYSAGAGPRDCRLPIADCRLALSAEVRQTGLEQTSQDTKTANQEKKTSVPEQKPTSSEQKPTVPEQKPTSPEQKPTVPEQKPAVNLQDYVGRYEADPSVVENFIFDVFVEKDELWVKPSHSPKSQLAAKGTDSFVITAINGPIKFTRDAKGLVQSMTLEGTEASGGRSATAKKLVLPAPSLKGSTTFRLKGHPNARVVAVAGSFNEFNQSQVLCGKEGDGWVCRLDLAPGKYTYKFIIDGDWILDPENPTTETDDRGFENSVIVVK